MKKIIKHLRKNWIRYGFETLVVIVGVLIAFTLSDWNQNRLARIDQIKVLKNIVDGFKKDKNDIAFNANVSKQVVSSSDIILQTFKSDIGYHDSLDLHFSGAFRITAFIANEGPYEVLKSKGLDLISNDSLRSLIINMHDVKYEALRIFGSGFFISDDYIREQLMKYFHIVELYEFGSRGRRPGKMKPHDFEVLKTDKEFNTLIRTFRAQTKLYGISYNEAILAELESLINNIESEIDRLE